MVRFTSMVSVLTLLSMASLANAATIISDSFTASNTTPLIGRTPTVDLPGGTYQVQGVGGYETDIKNNHAVIGADIGVATSLSSAGTYTKPTQIQISATINEGTWAADTFPTRVADLGFFNSSLGTGGNGFLHFTGLSLNPTGVLTLITPDAVNQASSAAVPGFDRSVDHALSYDINTVSGTISHILLDGNSVALTALPNTFTDAATAFAGFAGSSTAGGQVGTFDNFLVQAVPEPSAVLMMLCGAAALTIMGGRRRKA
jgi:hypothetical protein